MKPFSKSLIYSDNNVYYYINSLPIPDPLHSLEYLAKSITENKKMHLNPQRCPQLTMTLHKTYHGYLLPLELLMASAAATAAKSLQSCPTLCDPRDNSPPGSPVPGNLQARTLEWVAISFAQTNIEHLLYDQLYACCSG